MDRRHAPGVEPVPGQLVYIGVPATGRRRGKGARRAGIMRQKGRSDLWAHLEGAGSDGGAEPCEQFVARHLECVDGRLDDAAAEPAPAGVHRSDAGALAVTQKQRETVGGEYGTDDARSGGKAPVRLGFRWRVDTVDDAGPMDLTQPERLIRELKSLPEPFPVFPHMPGYIADVKCQIQAGIGRAADTAEAGTGVGADAGRYRPIGDDELLFCHPGNGSCAGGSVRHDVTW